MTTIQGNIHVLRAMLKQFDSPIVLPLNQDSQKIALKWVIDNAIKQYYDQLIVLITNRKNLDELGLKGISHLYKGKGLVISYNPSKFEISLLRKSFVPQGYAGIDSLTIDLPQYIISDKYFATQEKWDPNSRAIYMECFILKEYVIEIGRRNIEKELKKWLFQFLNSHNWTGK